MRLIQAAVDDTRILPCCGVRSRRAYRHRRFCRWRRGRPSRGLRGAALNRCCWRRRFLLGIRFVGNGLAVRDELRIARSARPRRRIGRQPARPMRPMVGDKAAAARKMKPKSEQSCRCNEPPGGHKVSRMPGAKFVHSVPPGWIAFVAGLWCQIPSTLTASRPEMPFGARSWR